MPSLATLYYVHDPMCSWCWGFRSTWDRLQHLLLERLGDSVDIQFVVGGLAPDTDEPMPAAQQEQISSIWTRIHQQLGTEFNFDFWSKNTPRRSTYMSCRAVIAAGFQGGNDQERIQLSRNMVDAIQRAYYLRALNPSDTSVLVQLAIEQGLDEQRFMDDLASRKLQLEFRSQLQLARRLPIQGFPSLVLQWHDQDISTGDDKGDEQGRCQLITLDYIEPESMAREVELLIYEI